MNFETNVVEIIQNLKNLILTIKLKINEVKKYIFCKF
jgi:hypothetical protein